ncbi:hypothetical protein CAEBREN_28199 [Caenorhabditis brenneri]|uniref:RRM domain-containing protein n=1 Tax=Caenorhabditis brenneri TaxID=135651 RepID=G0MV45_CAEBE|nr:hypothetical protein CAEBREN_28199 [Caenorhabditis brenneri]
MTSLVANTRHTPIVLTFAAPADYTIHSALRPANDVSLQRLTDHEETQRKRRQRMLGTGPTTSRQCPVTHPATRPLKSTCPSTPLLRWSPFPFLMVCGPSTYDVISSRHVTISGLPKTITDERFGPVQRLFRPAENQKLLCVTFIDPEAAALACDSNHYDENTPYEIKLSNRESMPDSDPDQSYSSEESSAHFYDPPLDDDETEGNSDYDIPVSDFINPSESNGESSQSRNSRDYCWGDGVPKRFSPRPKSTLIGPKEIMDPLRSNNTSAGFTG